ncbi:choice-of-anchor J domain-containing protein [Hymenobacter sp. 15J16-1T3B]|uniref:T9SS-dependent choice-of-anchor J family protein n=1 Tax=Hymenobacter sp. 15J16-1T3B TaxID=2886941 RepID=UPI001D0F5CA7|nr:choice-of-anchor J domain-containing protein [Hymenobacter sp. 15J16-1T3B]MCC3160297.1 choice-of-anchor J domain-containing protein [Hymenobacter sp. 15J16-1T3B]
MKSPLLLGLLSAGLLGFASQAAQAQTPVTLASTPYTENFDNLATGLPAGFGVYTGATATAPGTAATFAPAKAAWNATAGGFKNVASATGLTATSSAADQDASTNRALALRQTGSLGDPGGAFVFQAANTTGKTDFSLSFKLQSLDNSVGRTVNWTVDYATGATPTAFTPLASGTGSTTPTFGSNTVTASFGTALDNQTGPVWIRIVALTASTGSGSRPTSAIDDFSLSWQGNPNAPTLTTSVSTLAFASQNIGTTSAPLNYTLTGANLTTDVTVAATGPFTVSKDNTTFASSVTLTAAEVATAKTLYVKFAPTVAGPTTGSLTHTSTGASTRTVSLTGTAVDPSQLSFDFQACTGTTSISDGWTQYSVTGPQTWACTTFGRDPQNPAGTTAFPSGVQINGFASGSNVLNEDWLISPALNLASTTFPLLSYWSRVAFNGAPLKLMVSTNYSGSGSPLASGVTWTDLNGSFPATGTAEWTQTTNVDLSAYKQAGVYIAFVYNSTNDEGARWTLDDVAVTNSPTAPPPAIRSSVPSLAFGFRAVNSTPTQTFTATFSNLTAGATITSSDAAFQVSTNGTTFGSTATVTQAAAAAGAITVTVRFAPTTASRNYTGNITLASTGATSVVVAVSGNTYDVTSTLEVVNWNVEWFGSATMGPTNDNQQYTNVSTIINSLNADIYALAEVVDTVRLRTMVAAMPGYAYRVSDFGSYADDRNDPDYADAQKLAFIYRTSVVSNPQFTSFFRCTEAQNCAERNYWSSGRFPFVMTANVTLNGVTKQVTFVLIHAKANTSPTTTSYARRKSGADGLKAKLDADYPTQNFVILGDFNDDLDQTITTGITPNTTSYSAFTNDAANYPALTLPLSLAGKKSTVSYNDVIDHVVVSNEMNAYYIPASAEIQSQVAGLVANYGSTTTDHYPVLTRYSFSPATATAGARTAKLGLYPNPVSKSVRVEVPEKGQHLQLEVRTADGRLVVSSTGTVEQLNQQLNAKVGSLHAGMYVVRIVGEQQTYVERFVKQ